MRTSDCEILIVPGLGGSGPDHWQSRWEAKLSSARRVVQADWERPDPDAWAGRLVEAVRQARGSGRPVVLVAHSLGVLTVVHAAPLLARDGVAGAFLVGPPDVEARSGIPEAIRGFGPIPRDPLPFPSVVVASRNDPYCAYDRAEELAYAWGAAVSDAGESGHINTESGHGPWPEGTMRFAGFLKTLGA